jgi:hypothetical protein
VKPCWAQCLGDCSARISGEHVVTAGTFTETSIRVKGLPWCLDEFKTIRLESFVRKVLCEHHNSRLSPVDAAAIKLRDALCEIAALSEARKKLTPQVWPVKTFVADGYGIERWCLKTLIALAFGGKVTIGNGDARPGVPPPGLVEIAYGLRSFQPPRAGLYWMGSAGEEVNVTEGVVISTFSNPSKRLAGARFWFWDLNLLLVLDNDGPTGPFSFTSIDGSRTVHPSTTYRPQRLHIGVHDLPSHILQFDWPRKNC